MDNSVKSKVNEFRAGLHSSRLNNSNYLLRSASKNNVPRRKGIYSKFFNKSTASRTLQLTSGNLSRHDSIQSYQFKQPDLSKLQTSQLNGKKVNETLSSMREPARNETRNETLSSMREPARNETRNDTLSSVREPMRNATRVGRVPNPPPQARQTSHEETNVRHAPKRTTVSDESISGPARVFSPRVVLKDIGFERDNDGFAIPARPVHRVKSIAEKTEDMKKQTILAISDFLDTMPQMESFYLLKRVDATLSQHLKKTAPQKIATNSFLEDKELDITNWLQNNTKGVGDLNLGSTTSTVPVNYPPSEVAESVARFPGFSAPAQPPVSSVYNLKNWTLVKGRDPKEVILQGDLYNMHSQDVIEENHASSKVIKAEGSRAQTSCCIYNLIPPFQDRKNCIPSAVKRYFEGGKFPKNWVEIINMWHLLNAAPSQPSCSQEEAAGFSGNRYDNERTLVENERMSIRVPAERDGVLSEREERILADRERRRVLAERERNHRLVQEAEEERERERECRRAEEDREPERRYQRAGEERERERHLMRAEEEREQGRACSTGEEESMEEDVRNMARNTTSSLANGVSRYGRKRKVNGRFESDTENKRQRVDLRKRLKTPIPSGRLSVVGYRTRSAQRGRRPDPFLITPKSSKVNKYKARRQTPGPQRGRRVIQDDTNSFNDSDIQ